LPCAQPQPEETDLPAWPSRCPDPKGRLGLPEIVSYPIIRVLGIPAHTFDGFATSQINCAGAD